MESLWEVPDGTVIFTADVFVVLRILPSELRDTDFVQHNRQLAVQPVHSENRKTKTVWVDGHFVSPWHFVLL